MVRDPGGQDERLGPAQGRRQASQQKALSPISLLISLRDRLPGPDHGHCQRGARGTVRMTDTHMEALSRERREARRLASRKARLTRVAVQVASRLDVIIPAGALVACAATSALGADVGTTALRAGAVLLLAFFVRGLATMIHVPWAVAAGLVAVAASSVPLNSRLPALVAACMLVIVAGFTMASAPATQR